MRKPTRLGIALACLSASFVVLGWRSSGLIAFSAFYSAVAFGAVSVAYLTGNVDVFGKRVDGTRAPWAIVVLAPYLFLARGVWGVTRRLNIEPAYNELNEAIIVSRRLLPHEMPARVASVVDLTSEFVDAKPIRESVVYLCRPMLDGYGPTRQGLLELAEEIIRLPKPVLIHCAQGHGRTGLVAAATIVAAGEARTAQDAESLVRAARPGVRLSATQRELLASLEN